MARRRSEKSFLSDADKAARREMLAELVTASLERLETGEGWREFLISRALHGDSLTQANAALAAFQQPGEIVASKRFWLTIPAGRKHNCVLIGKAFWPAANWSSRYMNPATHAALMALADHVNPDPARCEELASEWRKMANTVAALQSFAFAFEAELNAAAGPVLEFEPEPEDAVTEFKSDPIPF